MLSGEERRRLNDYPSQADGCVVYELWEKYFGPRPPDVGEIELSSEEFSAAKVKVRKLIDTSDRETDDQ